MKMLTSVHCWCLVWLACWTANREVWN